MTRLLPLLLLLAPLASAQKKPPAKPEPKILMALPFGVAPGKAVRVELRGLKLERIKEAKLATGKGTLKIIKKEKVGVPDRMEASRVGDSRVEVELLVAAYSP